MILYFCKLVSLILLIFISSNVVCANSYCLFSVFACMSVCFSMFRQINALLKYVKLRNTAVCY